MKHVGFLFFLLISSQIALAQKDAAIAFNDDLTYITDSLYSKGQAWGKVFNKARESGNYSSLKPLRVELGKYIDQQIIRVKNMQDVQGSQDLMKAMIDFLNFEKTMVAAFIPLEKLTANSPNEELNKALDNLTALAAKENDALQKVGDAQDAYAKKNGFTIEKPEEGK